MASVPAVSDAAPVAEPIEPASEAAARAKYDANRQRMAEARDGFIADLRELLAASAK
jgi:hypothetical protein